MPKYQIPKTFKITQAEKSWQPMKNQKLCVPTRIHVDEDAGERQARRILRVPSEIPFQ